MAENRGRAGGVFEQDESTFTGTTAASVNAEA